MKLASSLFPNQWRLLAASPQFCLQAFIFSTGTLISSSYPWFFIPWFRFCSPLTSLSLFISLHHKVSHFLVSNLASMSESSDSCFSSRHFKLPAHFLHYSKADWNPCLSGKFPLWNHCLLSYNFFEYKCPALVSNLWGKVLISWNGFGFDLQEKQPPVQEGLGAFQKLPMVMPSIDLYCSALKKSKRVQPTKGNWFLSYRFVHTFRLFNWVFVHFWSQA